MRFDINKVFLFMCCIALFSVIGMSYTIVVESSQCIGFFIIGVGACLINFSFYQHEESFP